MSSIVDALYELKYNPFEYGPYIASFYIHSDELENNLLLAQLVIPLCSHPIYRHKLLNSNKRSSIWTVFDDRTKLYDLQERIDGFQVLTEQSIQYCLINGWLSVNEQRLSLAKCEEGKSTFISQKVAEKLAKLFSGHSVVDIYVFLGVKPR
ncbi:DUF6521 family protein [Acinetobacter baumannii]|uniref:three component ABC system middle component n=1 Tax=Acinetobacter baumannii TaxID=470 RepID=UPI000FB2C9AE|nr:three component ABC system middle component [Acinetobacter baumannii]MDC4769551.1 DUF6521 family protein [Acinetobacter baumannii]MDC5067113.1 DUF6521 family protein [Acinetobacter baumannii]MDC5504193.1 DUF6521 family protein [Acinetobacter baumannii]MDH2629727.1 DUF6521 family protein [Acinetobacter baumannii]RUT42777.1 hypothetical protein EM030_09695 [Acinetobacter baumannii]